MLTYIQNPSNPLNTGHSLRNNPFGTLFMAIFD